MKRQRTNYPGVFYREADRIGGTGNEKVFYIVFKKNGKVFEEKVGRQYADDMTPARAAKIRGDRLEGRRPSRKEIREQEAEQRQAEEKRWTVDRIWDEYRRQTKGSKSLPIEEMRYRKHVQQAFGHKEPQDILPLDVDRVRIRLLKTHKPKSVANALKLLRRIVRFAQKKQLCPPLGFIIELPRVNNEKTEDLTPEELTRLLAILEANPLEPAVLMMKLALFTGMRRGELFKLKWQDIDFERGFILLRDPKGGPDVKIPLNDSARAVLGDIQRGDNPLLFPGRKGGLRVSCRTSANRIKKEAGLPADFRPLHGLRHVFASILASSGQVDMYTLQKLMTHKSPAMTQRYAHLRDESLRRASELAADIITETMTAKGRGAGQGEVT
jgi:integrase